jgi:hypothetical protein
MNLSVGVMSHRLLDLINQVYSEERNSHLLLPFEFIGWLPEPSNLFVEQLKFNTNLLA